MQGRSSEDIISKHKPQEFKSIKVFTNDNVKHGTHHAL